MPITVQLPNGQMLEFPDGTDPEVIKSTARRIVQNPLAGVSTAELKAAPSAGTSIGDIGRSLGTGLVGGVKSIADVFGAGTDVSEYLGETMQGIQAGISPERQAEMSRRAELISRADKSGSLMEQAKAYLGGVTEAPLQTTVQALGTSVPTIVAGLATLPASAPAGIAAGVGLISRLAIGAAQGVGEFKGSAYDAVKEHYLKEGKSPEEAGRLAEEAQQYSADKAVQIGGAALLGSLDAVLGSENIAMKAMRRASPTGQMTKEAIEAGIGALPEKALTKPSFGRALGESVIGEAPLEGAQGAFGQYAQNVALQQAGIETPTGEGVFGSGLRDALVGSLAGGAFSPLHKSTMNSAYNIDQFLRQAKGEQELATMKEAAQKTAEETEARVKTGLGVPSGEMLALPAPAAKAEREIEPALIDLQNPVGRITRNELPADTLSYIDSYRTENNLPRLTSFSLEDVKDAMTSQNPEGERAALDSIIAAKTGYTGKEKYSPEDILNAAVEKNIAPETKGFGDFLQRTTGERDLNTMSQPQLFSAFNALKATKPSATGEQIVLPEGSNATRFTTDQYNEGLTLLGKYLEQGEGKPLSMQQATEVVSAQTDLGDYAKDILRVAATNDDVIVENGPVYNTVDTASGEVTGTYGNQADAEAQLGKGEAVQAGRGPLVRSRIEEKKPARAALPGGYEVEEEALQAGEKPAEYQIMAEGKAKPLATVMEETDVAGKVERLQGLRQKEAEKLLTDIGKHEKTVASGRAKLESMEARGLVDTEGFKKAQAQQAKAEDILGRRIQRMLDQIEEFSAPLKAKPAGKKQVTRTTFKLTKEGKDVGRFPSRAAAEESALSELSDAELEAISTQEGPTANRAAKALEARKEQAQGKTGIKVKGKAAGLEAAGIYTQDVQAKIAALEKQLVPMLAKFGLGDVGLKIVRTLEAGAEGSYLDKLIQVTLTADQPIVTMRHEALHALKDMGFFTPAQWSVLEKKANDEWIGKYLKGQMAEFNGKTMTRYEAYKAMGLTDEDILEEAIADAFGAFELGTDKPTPGMIAALFKRLQDFFTAFAQALGRAKIESAEEIFGKVERGELAKAGLEQTAKEKLSLARVPYSTRGVMESEDTKAREDLGLKTTATRGRFNNVREIAKALNKDTLDKFGAMDRKKLTEVESDQIATAIADEVEYQLGTTATTGTGLGWYSNNYPKAVKKLAKRFPELGTNPHARSIFTAIVAVTSNGEKVSKNISNAVTLYSKFRDGEPLVAMANRRGTALENNLKAIEELIARHGKNFQKVLLEEMTVKDMNNALRARGEKADGSYLADTVVPAAAVYFGPKLGAFYANLSGSEGYLTMDLWWTRSINRMRGLLIPKATDASISKFRDMMDQPSASRDEVIAASIPLRNKYEEFGWNSELEHLVEQKEPAKKAEKEDWFKRAKAAAGDSYDQLIYEHNLEKMANTIYKNEYDMLEEAPFTATDRAFMYEAARKAQDDLRGRGIDLTLADIQAALWYYEKRLYGKLSGKKADDIGYEEAILAQADQGDGRAGPSVVFSAKPNRGAVPIGEGQKADGLRGKRPEDQAKLSLGKTVAVDKDGKPLQLYHATYSAFDTPKINYGTNEWKQFGFHVGPLKAAQNRLGIKAAEDKREGVKSGTGGPNIIPVYLDIRNPLRLDESRTGRWGVDDIMSTIMAKADKDGDISRTDASLSPLDVEMFMADEFPIEAWLAGETDPDSVNFNPNAESKIWSNDSDFAPGEKSKLLIDFLQTLGYDSIVYENKFEGGGDSYIALDAKQVKSQFRPEGKFSLKTSFATAEEAENAANEKAPPQTPEFKLFYGASKLIDEGRPQVMYHGSDTDITTFYENKPIFVTPEAEFAQSFAEDRAKDNGKSASDARVYPLWVRAETPFDYENSEHVEQVMQRLITDQGATKFDSKLRLNKSTGAVDKVREEMRSGLWSVIEDKTVQDVIKQLGFDSFNVMEGGNKNLAVYSAAQVKSVTGNIGEFGREAKDIRFSLPKVSKQVADRVNATTTTREVKGFAERITDAISPKARSYFRAKALNRYNQLGVYDRKLAEKMGGVAFLADTSAEAGALFSDLGAGVTASALGFGDRNGGVPVYRNGVTTVDRSVKGLVASLAPLAQYGDPKVYQYYQYWAAVKRGTRLLEGGRERLIDKGDIALAAELEKKFPEFVQVQKDYTAFNNGVVKYMVDTGVLSQERGNEYMKYADYVPFYRQADGETTIGPNIFQAISGVKPPKKLKGSEAPLADFLETIVRNTQASIQAGMKNAAAQRAVNVASQISEPGMGAVRLDTKQSGPDILNVLEKGEQVSYRTPDSLLVDAIGSLHMPDIPFIGILSAPSDLLRNLVTKDPGFMMANLMRDSLSAWVTSGQKMTPIAGTVINFGKALAGKSPGMEALMDAGIIGGYEFSANVESSGAKLSQDLLRKSGKEGKAAPLRAARWVWEALEKGTTASDAATRALVYERVMQETGNEAEALYRSLEVMNFNRKGSSPVIRVLTAAVPFFNARLQGLDLFYRASWGRMNMDNAKGIQKAFWTRGAVMFGLTAMYWFLTHDDDEYKKQEQETRDNNWLLPSIGVKIPTPFEVGVLFKTVPERILEYTFGDDTGKDFAKSMGHAMLSTFAFNPIPQTVKPAIEVATNFNFFTMRPIIGQGMEGVASQYQVGPGTSKAFEAFGSMTGLSPIQVEHLYKGYTGTMGMYLVDVVDSILNANSNSPNATKRFEQLPVIKRFALDKEARGTITQYYELKNAVDSTVKTMNMLEKTAKPAEFAAFVQENKGYLATKDYVRDLEKEMKELREMRTLIRSSTLSGDQKRDANKTLTNAENNLTANIQTIKTVIASMK